MIKINNRAENDDVNGLVKKGTKKGSATRDMVN